MQKEDTMQENTKNENTKIDETTIEPYIRDAFKATLLEIDADAKADALAASLNEQSVLLESGLDSLGFAVLVARLEEELGLDPFAMMDTPTYPVTYGEFIDIYKKYIK